MNKLDEKVILQIKSAVSDAIDEKVKDFYIDREKHWRHHQQWEEFNNFWSMTKKTAWRTFIVTIISGTLGLLWLGYKLMMWTNKP